MRFFTAATLLFPLAVWAQNVSVSTSFLVTNVLTVSNGNRVFATITSAIPITITAAASNAASTSGTTSNSTNSASSASGSNAQSGSTSTTQTSSTSSSPLPTAVASTINGGGNQPGGAPTPGAKAANGIYGPDDNYHTSGALVVHATMIVMTSIAAGAGAMLLCL